MSETLIRAAQSLPLSVDGSAVPTVLWTPTGAVRGLVLACHGGSGHKLSPAVLAIAQACLPLGLTVLAIDGPVHGDRRTDGNLDPSVAVRAFRAAWQQGLGRSSMAREMAAALDLALRRPGWATLPVGYIGVSMGTAYGIPLLASDPRVRAAAIGLWGLDFPGSEHLGESARAIQCPVWFAQQWDDQTFSRTGVHALFDAIASPDKRLMAFPGPHRELEGERLREAIRFLADRLLAVPH